MMRKNISAIIDAVSTHPAGSRVNESITHRGKAGGTLKKMLEAPAPNTTIAPVIEPEPTVGREMPVGIFQCSVCKVFSTDGQAQSPCPTCGNSGTYARVGDVVPTGDPGLAQLTVDAQADINEALNLLNKGQTKKFAESYGNRTRVTKRGSLELSYTKGSRSTMVEAVMNLRQKSAYDLAVKLMESASKVKQAPSKLQEFAESKRRAHKTSRVGLRVITEMNSLVSDVTRLLERMGIKYDHKKLTEQLTPRLQSRIRKLTEDTARYIADNSYNYRPANELTEAQYSEAARNVVAENGLEVVSAETTFDGDAAQVKIRIQDNENTTIDLADVADVLAQEYEADVVVLAQEVPGDPTMTDVTLVVNEAAVQDDLGEGGTKLEEEELPIEESVARHNKRIAESVIASAKANPAPAAQPVRRPANSRRPIRRAHESVGRGRLTEAVSEATIDRAAAVVLQGLNALQGLYDRPDLYDPETLDPVVDDDALIAAQDAVVLPLQGQIVDILGFDFDEFNWGETVWSEIQGATTIEAARRNLVAALQVEGRLNEATTVEAIQVDEDTRYFVLSTESPDDDPSVLAFDGALVSLADVDAEESAAVFNDVESAQAFIEENNLVGSCRVVSGSIVPSDSLDECGPGKKEKFESFKPTAKSGRKVRSRRK